MTLPPTLKLAESELRLNRQTGLLKHDHHNFAYPEAQKQYNYHA